MCSRWVLKYHLYFNLSSWGKAYLIDDQSRGNNKQSRYVNVHERAEKIAPFHSLPMLDTTRFPHGHRLNNVFETGANNQTKVALKDNERGKISDLVVSVRPEHGLFKTATGKAQVLSQISYLKTDIRSYDLLKISVMCFKFQIWSSLSSKLRPISTVVRTGNLKNNKSPTQSQQQLMCIERIS